MALVKAATNVSNQNEEKYLGDGYEVVFTVTSCHGDGSDNSILEHYQINGALSEYEAFSFIPYRARITLK